MNGKAVSMGKEDEVYRKMLGGRHFGWAKPEIDNFRKFVRNGLMHDAETRNQWIVQQTIPKHSIIQKRTSGGYVINRTKFHKAVEATFKDWITELSAGDAPLRRNMRDRMNEIIKKHYTA